MALITSGNGQDIWYYWTTGNSTATATATTETAWTYWASTATSTTSITLTCATAWDAWAVVHHTQQTAAERAAREHQWAEQRAQWEAEAHARKQAAQEATARAQVLLLRHLSDTQRQSYEAHGYFDVLADDGQHYRVHKGVSHNVKLLDPESHKEVTSYCAHPREDLPVGDVMLAQKLMLEYNAAEFMRIANSRALH